MRDDSDALRDRLDATVRRCHGALAAAVLNPEAYATVVVGADPEGAFEIGSISKAVTGLLYADAVADGRVEPSMRLGDLLDVGHGTVGAIALSDLATHRSGLPRLPAGMNSMGRSWELWRRGANPYGDSLDELLVQARLTGVGRRRFRYSNLGFELLGHAVASARSTTYGHLLRTRLTDPVGMDRAYAPYAIEDLRPTALPGYSRHGRRQDAWTGEALAPAGGIRATITDMSALLRALLDGTAPGIRALDPVTRLAGPASIGAAWMIVPRKGSTLTWHNGRTGGFASWIGVDRERGAGAVVLSGTSRSVDRLGTELLDWVCANGSGT